MSIQVMDPSSSARASRVTKPEKGTMANFSGYGEAMMGGMMRGMGGMMGRRGRWRSMMGYGGMTSGYGAMMSRMMGRGMDGMGGDDEGMGGMPRLLLARAPTSAAPTAARLARGRDKTVEPPRARRSSTRTSTSSR